ncbi:hypothetical protein [Vibrio superstes]|uniref:Uncharacterized protein n=1 Tax=Vibrio superstes NBRC 103154 TaxID=1219062 RepID=A0A511QX80_9VIBR|nr:hypothetical protein [Vibrio superstes]GEM81346.1 hypothetical protein VSU01S_35910 [Vibrio superstes NBRC 103154]
MNFIHQVIRVIVMALLGLNILTTALSFHTLDTAMNWVATGLAFVWMLGSLYLVLTNEGDVIKEETWNNWKMLTLVAVIANVGMVVIIPHISGDQIIMALAPFLIINALTFTAVSGRYNRCKA